MDYNRELKLLYILDFGQKQETVFRLVGTSFGTVIIYLYTGWWYSWLWAGLFSVGLGICWLAHRHWAGRANAKVVAWFHAAVLINSVLFIWMPVKLIAYNDTPLSLSGAAVLGCFYVFMMRQLDHAFRVVVGQICILLIASGIAVAALLPEIEMPIAMVGLAFTVVAFNLYFIQVVLKVRKDQQQFRLAAERSSQASKMEALGQMAGGVAHDFNNILTAAMGNLELAKVVETEAERHECLDQAHNSLDRAARVIRELLQFARPTETSIELRPSSEVLDKVYSIATHTLPNSVAVATQVTRRPLWVRIDEDQFITAMMNLLINASDAAGSGGHISIGVASVTTDSIRLDIAQQSIAPGRYVQFSVVDDGPGVPSDIADAIVKPFFTTKLGASGTGLGLPMVQAFAHRMGGGLVMSSCPGETRFSLLLPQSDPPVDDREFTSSRVPLPGRNVFAADA